MRGSLFSLLVVMLLTLPLHAVALDRIRIVVSEEVSYGLNSDLLIQTYTQIKKSLPQYEITLERHSAKDLKRKVTQREADLFLTSSATYRQLLHTGARDLATMVSLRANDPNHSEGGVILVHENRTDLQRLTDLRGKSVAASEAFGFSGYESVLAELPTSDHKQWFSQVIQIPPDLERFLNILRSGQSDAIILPTCLMEWYSETSDVDTSWVRVINPKIQHTLQCMHSTRLYPNITLATTPSLSPKTSREITKTLLLMPSSRAGMYWSVATDFSSVDALLKKLDLDSQANLRRWSVQRIWQQYWPWFMLLGFGMICLLLHSLRVSVLVRQRTDQLAKALKEQQNLQNRARDASLRLERLQKTSIIGQMSGLFAHELRQPLSSIRLWAFSIKKMIERGETSCEELFMATEKITDQTQRAEAIVQRVRDYAKSKKARRTPQSMDEIIRKAISSFQTTSSGEIPVDYVCRAPECNVLADPFEIELALVNLFRNSAEVQTKEPIPKIWVELSIDQGNAIVSVTDNGAELPDDAISKMSELFSTTKPEGLGMGLSIVQSIIVDQHNGTIHLDKGLSGGLKVTIFISLDEVPT